jgi:hypothetical protein
MTYTLFECLKENLTDHLAALEEEQKNKHVVSNVTESVEKLQVNDNKPAQSSAPVVKKEQLTKAQKRKIWNRSDNTGTRPRGWDWVDIIKHLSQTGGKPEESAPPSSSVQQQAISSHT